MKSHSKYLQFFENLLNFNKKLKVLKILKIQLK